LYIWYDSEYIIAPVQSAFPEPRFRLV